MQPIELEKLGDTHPLNRAMRRVARHWPVVYSKLLCLTWEWTDATGYHPKGGHVPYGATDGRLLILHPEGVDKMAAESKAKVGDPVGYIAFLLVHEGLHAILNHGFRLSKFADHEMANHAADYKVNEMTASRNREIGGHKPPFPLPSWVLLDLAMSTPLTTEQLYQQLKRNAAIPPTPPTPPPFPSPDPDPDAGDGQAPGPDEDTGTPTTAPASDVGSDDGGDPDPADSGEVDGGGVGDSPDGDPSAGPSPEAESGDQSPESGAQTPGPGDGKDGTGDPRPGAGGGDTFKPTDDELTDAELEREIEEQNERLMIQDSIDSHQCGTAMTDHSRLAKERRAAEAQDWAAYAEQFVETRCSQGWRSPYNHGVFVTTGLAAPGREGRKVGDIVMVVDSSCSIGQDAWERFLQLGQFILDDVKPERLLLLSCDTRVVEAVELVSGDIVPTKMKGGGGTSFKAAFDWIEEDPDGMAIDPLLLIYFTDGHCSDHHNMTPPPYPVLWLSYQRKADNFPWGGFAEITVK